MLFIVCPGYSHYFTIVCPDYWALVCPAGLRVPPGKRPFGAVLWVSYAIIASIWASVMTTLDRRFGVAHAQVLITGIHAWPAPLLRIMLKVITIICTFAVALLVRHRFEYH